MLLTLIRHRALVIGATIFLDDPLLQVFWQRDKLCWTCVQPATPTPRVRTSQTARAKFATASTALLEMEEPSVKVGKKLLIYVII